VKRRKLRPGKIPVKDVIKAEETIELIKQKFNIEITEED